MSFHINYIGFKIGHQIHWRKY